MRGHASEASYERVVFSVLYNESDGFLATYVENFLRHTDAGVFLVVNLPPGRSIACPIAGNSDRVLVFSGALPRRKYGHTLLNGHLEAFDVALAHLGQFDYFCTLASNSLFARRFDLPATRAALLGTEHAAAIDLDDLPDGWWWTALAKNPAMVAYIKDVWGLTHASGNQIEGLFATAADWGLLHRERARIVELGDRMVEEFALPMEEILPASFICGLGSRRYVGICHMFWDRPMDDNVKLDDVLGIADRFPDHTCLLKWFERSPTNLVTAATAKGVIGDLTARLSGIPAAERAQQRVLYRMIFEELARTLRPGERFSSLMSTWRLTHPRHDFERTIDIRRDFIPLPLGLDGSLDGSPAHLITEQTGDRLHLRFSLVDAGQTLVTLSSSLAAGERDGTRLQGFLYLACRLGPGNRIFRLRVLSDDGDPAVQLSDRIVLSRGGRYGQQGPAPIIEHDGVREFYYMSEATPDAEDVWFGVPFFDRSDFSIAIDAV